MNDLTTVQLPASWLSTRFGIDAREIEKLRASGELYAVEGEGEWLYSAWQFGPGGAIPEAVRNVVRVAKQRGIDEPRLAELLRRRVGLVGGQRLVDLLFAGNSARIVAELRTA